MLGRPLRALLPRFGSGQDPSTATLAFPLPARRFGTFAVDVYQERSECQRGLRILQDRTDVFGRGGRRLWTECRKFGREREVTS
jgi:hypothetical protein